MLISMMKSHTVNIVLVYKRKAFLSLNSQDPSASSLAV